MLLLPVLSARTTASGIFGTVTHRGGDTATGSLSTSGTASGTVLQLEVELHTQKYYYVVVLPC